MAIKAIPEHSRLDELDRIAGVDGDRSTSRLRPVLTRTGLGALGAVVYGASLFAAAVTVSELVALIPGVAGTVVLFTVGVLLIAAAPSVADWTLTRVLESVSRT